MKNHPTQPLIWTSLALSLLLAANANANDEESGKSLHDGNCVACHDNHVYTRSDRRVGDRGALATQVTRCETNLNLQWFDEQRDAVIDYLNDSYYHF
jgi:mono/diheme cytochrome c family protein